MKKSYRNMTTRLYQLCIITILLPLCMCADFPDSVKKLDALVTTNIFFWPGRNPEVIQPDPENIGPACSCGTKDEMGSSMIQSTSIDDGEESDFSSYSNNSDIKSSEEAVRYKKGEILVRFRKGVSESRSKITIQKSGLALSEKLLSRNKSSVLREIRLNTAVSVEKAITELKRNPDVEYVQPNYIYRLTSVPDDYEFSSQWGLQNTGQTIIGTSGTSGFDINAVNAWDVTTDCRNVIIAVLDTGVNYTHRDLADNMWDGSSCVDESANPLGGCITGYDFVDDDKEPKDMKGHGTHVAGIIGAKGNDGNRISGVCWTASIMAIRVLDITGEGTTADIVSGINFAIKNGAKIINASWGSSEYDEILYNAIKEARDSGVLFIAAAGNYQSNSDLYPKYPSCYDLENIISVGASDQNGKLAYFSSYGVTSVDIAAPGTNILSDFPAQIIDAYEYFSSWKRDWGWSYEDYILNNKFYGILRIDKSRNYMDSYAYRVFDFSINDPDYIILNFGRRLYHIQDGMNYVHLVYNTDGDKPDNILTTMNKSITRYSYDFTPHLNKKVSIGFRFVTQTVVPNEDLEIDPFMISRWYHYNNSSACLYLNGTSMSTPYVTGVAGLVWSANTGLTYTQVKSKILNGSRFNDNLTGKIAGSRMLDAAGALSAAP